MPYFYISSKSIARCSGWLGQSSVMSISFYLCVSVSLSLSLSLSLFFCLFLSPSLSLSLGQMFKRNETLRDVCTSFQRRMQPPYTPDKKVGKGLVEYRYAPSCIIWMYMYECIVCNKSVKTTNFQFTWIKHMFFYEWVALDFWKRKPVQGFGTKQRINGRFRTAPNFHEYFTKLVISWWSISFSSLWKCPERERERERERRVMLEPNGREITKILPSWWFLLD